MKVYGSDSVPLEQVEHGEGVSIQWLIDEKQGAPNFALRRFEVLPGGATPLHSHNWEHEVYILEGRGAVRGAEKEAALAAGDVAYVPPNEQHQFVNVGQTPMMFLCVVPLSSKG